VQVAVFDDAAGPNSAAALLGIATVPLAPLAVGAPVEGGFVLLHPATRQQAGRLWLSISWANPLDEQVGGSCQAGGGTATKPWTTPCSSSPDHVQPRRAACRACHHALTCITLPCLQGSKPAYYTTASVAATGTPTHLRMSGAPVVDLSTATELRLVAGPSVPHPHSPAGVQGLPAGLSPVRTGPGGQLQHHPRDQATAEPLHSLPARALFPQQQPQLLAASPRAVGHAPAGSPGRMVGPGASSILLHAARGLAAGQSPARNRYPASHSPDRAASPVAAAGPGPAAGPSASDGGVLVRVPADPETWSDFDQNLYFR
jgi:hypothetical protein